MSYWQLYFSTRRKVHKRRSFRIYGRAAARSITYIEPNGQQLSIDDDSLLALGAQDCMQHRLIIDL